MKIIMIHGQNHEGSTCMVARKLAQKVKAGVDGECTVQEFFLPRDFDKPCLGCVTCLQKDLSFCPHFKQIQPISDAILVADLLILDSPVYVYHATGQMMSFLDHFATWWIIHRPRIEMVKKQAVVISMAAGAGMKWTCKDMADSLEMWGIRKVYRMGFSIQAMKPEKISARNQKKIEARTSSLARKIASGYGKIGMNARAKRFFYLVRFAHNHFLSMEPDCGYWEKKWWHGKKRPWRHGK